MKEQFLLVLAVIVLAAVFIAMDSWHFANAAPTEPVPQCKEVSKTPNLSVYLCEPDNGPPFYINSYGFMVLVE